MHIFFHEAPVWIKLVLPGDPWRSLHHHINTMEISLSVVAIHKAMCGCVYVNTSWSWISYLIARESITIKLFIVKMIWLIARVFEKYLNSLHIQKNKINAAKLVQKV